MNTRSLAAQVQDVLRERIVTGHLAPGSRIAPDELAVEFGTSVTPVRDALRLLERDGLVLIRPRRGVHVASEDVKTFRDVFDVRISLECLAIETAVQRIPMFELETLSATYAASADALARDESPEMILGPSDSTIHDLIVDYSDNRTVRELMQSLRDRITWVRGIAAKRAHRYALSFAEHRWILEALIERDVVESAARLREHLRRARDHTLSVLIENKD